MCFEGLGGFCRSGKTGVLVSVPRDAGQVWVIPMLLDFMPLSEKVPRTVD